jgi:hypothetical protein
MSAYFGGGYSEAGCLTKGALGALFFGRRQYARNGIPPRNI